LAARLVIGRKHLLVSHNRIHDRGNVLSALIRVPEPERVPEFVEKDAADIGDRDAMGDELERATIRIEDGSPIKEHVRLYHVGA
jgi:hypothetical protein